MGVDTKGVLVGFHTADDVALFLAKAGYRNVEVQQGSLDTYGKRDDRFTTRTARVQFDDPNSPDARSMFYFHVGGEYDGSAPMNYRQPSRC
jgi:hypothetical protein